jgi:hypothetical protein
VEVTRNAVSTDVPKIQKTFDDGIVTKKWVQKHTKIHTVKLQVEKVKGRNNKQETTSQA